MLTRLTDGVQAYEKAKGKKHQIFRLSFDAKLIEGLNKINQVLDYIHHNPISGKWTLCDVFTDFPYSSAAFYEDGINNEFNCDDYRQFI